MTFTKKIVMIAGPNGAGKTTFAREFLPKEGDCTVFINADLIAAGLSPFAPETMAIKAGKLMLEATAENAQSGNNFSLETTLSGLGYSRTITYWPLLWESLLESVVHVAALERSRVLAGYLCLCALAGICELGTGCVYGESGNFVRKSKRPIQKQMGCGDNPQICRSQITNGLKTA
jgi:energy-coupling factor transporter ATP-binding protein EcfA2